MPIDKVTRHDGDILVAFDVNDIDVEGIRNAIITEVREQEEREEKERELDKETKTVIEAVRHNDSLTLLEKIKLARAQGHKIIEHHLNSEDIEPALETYEDNYYSILSRTFSIMNHALAKAAAERYNPEILVKMPFDAFDEIGDYARAKEISEVGRELMKKALDKYEANN